MNIPEWKLLRDKWTWCRASKNWNCIAIDNNHERNDKKSRKNFKKRTANTFQILTHAKWNQTRVYYTDKSIESNRAKVRWNA